MKRFYLLLLIFIHPLCSYNNSQSLIDQQKLASLQLRLLSRTAPVLSSARTTFPIMAGGRNVQQYADMYFEGASIAVLADKDGRSDLAMFNPEKAFASVRHTSLCADAAYGILIKDSWFFGINAGGWPESSKKHSSSTFKTSAKVSRLIASEKYNRIGIWIDAGYAYSLLETKHTLDLKYTDTNGTAAFDGKLTARSDAHVFISEIRFQKNFFLFNFSTGLAYSLTSAAGKAEISSQTAGFDSLGRVKKHEVLHSFITRCGFEVILGKPKLTFEAGRDWMGRGFFALFGIKIGM